MKTYVLIGLCIVLATFNTIAFGQSIVGSWQLVNQSTCVDDDIEPEDESTEDVLNDMKAMSKPATQVIILKDNNSGEESTKIISKKKSYNSKSFLYRYSSNTLYFLDKRSKTIIEGFNVEKLSADSLIISNTERACETKVFVRIK